MAAPPEGLENHSSAICRREAWFGLPSPVPESGRGCFSGLGLPNRLGDEPALSRDVRTPIRWGRAHRVFVEVRTNPEPAVGLV